ncbi:hypothetical protein [Reichenbachiella versicolor]|uniref:hypothetical protein n=1 Tax=Reichenbachiella versicolor TaxID=1821036 RepID=UPI000D6E8CE5|nr:hypothetical protein [Reichenbachiella versicolor]
MDIPNQIQRLNDLDTDDDFFDDNDELINSWSHLQKSPWAQEQFRNLDSTHSNNRSDIETENKFPYIKPLKDDPIPSMILELTRALSNYNLKEDKNLEIGLLKKLQEAHLSFSKYNGVRTPKRSKHPRENDLFTYLSGLERKIGSQPDDPRWSLSLQSLRTELYDFLSRHPLERGYTHQFSYDIDQLLRYLNNYLTRKYIPPVVPEETKKKKKYEEEEEIEDRRIDKRPEDKYAYARYKLKNGDIMTNLREFFEAFTIGSKPKATSIGNLGKVGKLFFPDGISSIHTGIFGAGYRDDGEGYFGSSTPFKLSAKKAGLPSIRVFVKNGKVYDLLETFRYLDGTKIKSPSVFYPVWYEKRKDRHITRFIKLVPVSESQIENYTLERKKENDKKYSRMVKQEFRKYGKVLNSIKSEDYSKKAPKKKKDPKRKKKD